MNEYWNRRVIKSQEEITNRSIEQVEKQLRKYYSKTMKTVIRDFEDTYNAYLVKIGNGEEPAPANLYNLSRYWELQTQLQDELQKLGDKESVLLSKAFMTQYQDVYENIALPSGATYATLDKELAKQMINSIWCADAKSWSSRIWENVKELKETLNNGLIECAIAGRKPTELKHLLQERFGVSYSRADALVRTEMAHLQTVAAQERYKQYGIQEEQVWASKDERRCPICAELHMKKFKVGTAPIPRHTNCRCCIIPVID